MLIGSEQLEWREALFKAFSEEEFRDLLLRLDDDIGQYSSTKTASKTAIGDVVAAYSRRDLEDQLIAKAIEARPRNSTLLKLASTKKAAAAPNATDLERLVRETTAYIDPEIWLQKAGKLQVCVCRIEIALLTGGKIYGTGFLIAPDLVMTNYHVVECVAAREDNSKSYVGPLARAEDVVCRFDYKVLANGMVNEGSSFRIQLTAIR
jgi:Effector-associated domain 1